MAIKVSLVCMNLSLVIVPLILVGAFSIGLLHWSAQRQVESVYNDSVNQIQTGIRLYVDRYVEKMKLVAQGVSKIEPFIFNQNIPLNGTFDPAHLIRYMNTLNGDDEFQSIGVMLKSPQDGSKFSWEVARGFGCDPYIYGFIDASNEPLYSGYCALSNTTVSTTPSYQGQDWGFKMEEQIILSGDQMAQTFLPIFPLLNILTLTFSVGLPLISDPEQMYALTFAQKSLVMIDNYFESLEIGNTGIAYIYERKTGLLVTASVAGQTFSVGQPDAYGYPVVTRLSALDAEHPSISGSAIGIQNQFGNLSFVTVPNKFTFGEFLISTMPYGDSGLDWVVVTCRSESEIYAPVRSFSIIAIGSSIAFSLVVIAIAAVFNHIVLKRLKKIKSRKFIPSEQDNDADTEKPLLISIREIED